MEYNLDIRLLAQTNITYQQIADLQHSAFQERLEQGLHFTSSSMTALQFEEKMKDGYVFVAIDTNTDTLLGTVTIHIGTDNKGIVYGYHEYLAVSPDAKHMGIGTKMADAWTKFLKEKGAAYVLSDTACKAASSVKWHLKNGFRIYELESYRSTNYWSYVFIKYLDGSIQKSAFRMKLHYWKSWILIRVTRHKNGFDTRLGVLYKKAKGKCRN